MVIGFLNFKWNRSIYFSITTISPLPDYLTAHLSCCLESTHPKSQMWSCLRTFANCPSLSIAISKILSLAYQLHCFIFVIFSYVLMSVFSLSPRPYLTSEAWNLQTTLYRLFQLLPFCYVTHQPAENWKPKVRDNPASAAVAGSSSGCCCGSRSAVVLNSSSLKGGNFSIVQALVKVAPLYSIHNWRHQQFPTL